MILRVELVGSHESWVERTGVRRRLRRDEIERGLARRIVSHHQLMLWLAGRSSRRCGERQAVEQHEAHPAHHLRDAKVCERDVNALGVSGGRFAHAAVSRRPPISLDTMVPRPYRGLRVRRWGLGFVHRSRAIFCRAVPTLWRLG
jgi:hypothetical protein